MGQSLGSNYKKGIEQIDTQGLYSLSAPTSWRKISWSPEAARFGFRLTQSLWNLTGTSGAALFLERLHYIDVIMTTMASQITSLTVVCSIIYSGADQRNIKAPRHWSLCGEFTGTGEFPAQRASNADNVSIWWRHHVDTLRDMAVRCLPA